MPLTSTRTPVTADHASWTRSHATRFVRWFLAVAVVVAGGSIVRAQATGLDAPARVDSTAERLRPEPVGLSFPIDPFPRCDVLDNFGGFSKYQGGSGHQGLDIGTDFRQAVYAVEDGFLYRVFEGSNSGLGWGLWSDTDWKYRYFHLDELEPSLELGDRVTAGQLIGWTGDTGNASPGGWHLHFEARPGPHPQFGSNPPVDPMDLLDIPDACTVY